MPTRALRRPGRRRAAGDRPFLARVQWLCRHAQRWAEPARHVSPPALRLPLGAGRQRRPDGADQPSDPPVHAGARVWAHGHRRGRHRAAQRSDAVPHRRLRQYLDWLARLRRHAAQPPGERCPPLLAVGQRDQGRRGQDLSGRLRRRPRRPVGAVDAGAHHPRRLHVPLGFRSRQLRDVHRPARRRRPDQRPGDGPLPV